MKFLIVNLILFLAFGNPDKSNLSTSHSANTGQYNLNELNQIKTLISKKAGTDFEKNPVNTFTLNGYSVYTKVTEHHYGPSIYEESFYDVQNPENEYRMRLVINPDGERELAVMVHDNNNYINYHACFDEKGIMLDFDPWGEDDTYSINVFGLYDLYQKIYSEKVNKIEP